MSHNIYLYRNLLIGISLILIGHLFDISFEKPSVKTINHGHSAAYRSKTIPDPISSPLPEEITAISDSLWPFTSQVDPSMTIGQLSFLFHCQSECPQLWLSLKLKESDQTTASAWLELPVFHPAIQKIDWFSLSDQGYYLYQQPMRYLSIETLLNNASTEHIIADDELLSLPTLNHAQSLKQTTHINHNQYLITRYKKPDKVGDWYIYQQQINFSNAEITNHQANWKLEQLGTKDTVFLSRLTGKVIR